MLEILPFPPYLGDMSFKDDISPTGGIRDFINYVREDRPLKPLLIFASCCPAAAIIYMFIFDAYEKSLPPPPTVTYVESWPLDRSIEESKAAIAERQKLKDALLEKQRQSYKALGRAVGMDVEAIEREANEIRAKAVREDALKKQKSAQAQRNEDANIGPQIISGGAP